MYKQKTLSYLFFIVFIAMLTGCSIHKEQTIADVYHSYHYLAVKFQHDHYLLITALYPELKQVAAVERDKQILRLQIKLHKFIFLSNDHPQKLKIDQGLITLNDLYWDDQLEKELKAKNPKYSDLTIKLEKLIDIQVPLKLEQREKIKKVFYHPQYVQLVENIYEKVEKLDEQLSMILNRGTAECLP